MTFKLLTVHIVSQGETLISIAQKYKLESWSALYSAPDNAPFRRSHPNPRLIYPGDKLYIPPNAIDVVKKRLKKLKEIKKEAIKSFEDQEKELFKIYKEQKQFAAVIDTAATVATMFAGLGKLCYSGYKSLSLSGKELAKFNSELMSTSAKAKDTALWTAGVAGSQVKITGDEGLAWGVTKVLLKSWSDMTSPTYWTKLVTGVDPDRQYEKARSQIISVKNRIVSRLSEKIKKSEELILQLDREKMIPIPLR